MSGLIAFLVHQQVRRDGRRASTTHLPPILKHTDVTQFTVRRKRAVARQLFTATLRLGH